MPKTEKFYFEGDAYGTDYASAVRIKSPWNERGAIAGGCVDIFVGDGGRLMMWQCHDGSNRNAAPILGPSTSRLGCSAKVLTRLHPVAGAEKFYFSS